MRAWRRWQDWGNVTLGTVLFFAPWLFGTSGDGTSSWNAWISGLLIVSVALWGLAVPVSKGAQWTNMVLGAWVVIAPFALGFTDVTEAAWTAFLIGAGVITMAVWALVDIGGHATSGESTS